MDAYQVFICKMSKNSLEKVYEIVGINYITPAFVKVTSDRRVKVGDYIEVDNEYAYYDGEGLGQVTEYKTSDDVSVDTNYNIKYIGGYSLDGKTVFLDERFPKMLVIKGKVLDAVDTIAKHHEASEKWMIDEGYSYMYSHMVATKVERQYVTSLGFSWDDYCREVNRQLHNVSSKGLSKSPANLDLSPYLDTRDRETLREIKDSVSTELISNDY